MGRYVNPAGSPYGGYFRPLSEINFLHPHEINQLQALGMSPTVRDKQPMAVNFIGKQEYYDINSPLIPVNQLITVCPERSIALCSENLWKEI